MNLEKLIAKDAREEAKSQARQMFINNDISIITPLLRQLRAFGIDTSTLINPSDSKDTFIKRDIVYTLKMILYYLYYLDDYDPSHINMSRPNLRGAIYDRLKMLQQLINHLNRRDLNLIEAWDRFKPMINNKLDTKESKNKLKTYTQRFLTEIHK